jgi:lysophospholipase L1-like esterase
VIGLPLLLAVAAPCVGPVCNFDTLAPYFAKLAVAREARGTPPVHILQIGDSHTAGDVLTGGWRDLLQAQFGNGGRGMLAPGRPYDGYFTRGVTASMSPGWHVTPTFGKGYIERHLPIGFSGFDLTSTVSGATMSLAADGPAMAFDRFVLCGFAGLLAKSVTVRTAEGAQVIDLTSDIAGPRCATLRFAAPQSAVEVVADTGPVTLLSWGTFRDDGGVVLSNVGIVGSQLQHFARTDDTVLAEELEAYAPDLIVLAFGTNEGFAPSIDTVAYEATLRMQIERLRAYAPDVPILLLGPPDALSRREELRGGQGNCPVLPGVAPLFAPPGLAQVRAVQRKVAADMHLAWWDWQARMGGLCSAERWVNQTPPLMRGDYVHFKTHGGQALARLLQDDLNHAASER